MFVTAASLGFINLVSALVYVFVLPAAGIIIALLFYDLRVRKEGVQTSPATARVEPEHRSGESRRGGSDSSATGCLRSHAPPRAGAPRSAASSQALTERGTNLGRTLKALPQRAPYSASISARAARPRCDSHRWSRIGIRACGNMMVRKGSIERFSSGRRADLAAARPISYDRQDIEGRKTSCTDDSLRLKASTRRRAKSQKEPSATGSSLHSRGWTGFAGFIFLVDEEAAAHAPLRCGRRRKRPSRPSARSRRPAKK